MNVNVDLSKVVPFSEIRGEDMQETEALKQMVKEARDYLSSFEWCGPIRESFLGIGVGGVVAVALFHIAPAKPTIDEWLWVIVGDLPPAYITAENAPNPACALDAYIGAMIEWVQAVRTHRPTDKIIPVNVPPSKEYADRLEVRLAFLDREVLSKYAEDLKC